MAIYLNSAELDALRQHFDWTHIVEEDRSKSDMEAAANDAMRIFHDVIKSVGKHCESYASDVCYEVTGFPEACKRIEQELELMSEQERNAWFARPHAVRLIGVRKMGVDHSEYVNVRCANGEVGEYLDLFLITVLVRREPYYTEFRFDLYRAKRKNGKVVLKNA